tara:strand:+ start:91 stop:258 length:168 start_codon:yes stop_codon:yes gene_type:complete
MVNSVSQSQLAKQRTARAQARRLKAAINAQIGRVGMWMTENERIEAKGRPVGVFR